MGFFKGKDDGLEDRLRSLRAEPRDEFVRELSQDVRPHRIRRAASSRRFVAALVAAAVMLVPFAAFGGVGYAASAAKNAVQTVVQVQAPKQDAKDNDNKGGKGDDKKPDDDQYR